MHESDSNYCKLCFCYFLLSHELIAYVNFKIFIGLCFVYAYNYMLTNMKFIKYDILTCIAKRQGKKHNSLL